MKLTKKILLIFSLVTIIVGCSSDDDNSSNATIRVNGQALFEDVGDFNGDIDGDFTGNGGSVTRTFQWRNALNTADYNADITATSQGTFRMIVKDANGTMVLDKSLDGGSEPDSYSGTTSTGVSGIWSVTITLGSFNGDGSFSLSEGD